MDSYRQRYDDVAAALRAALPQARVMVVDGDKAGCWIEAEQDGTVVTAGDQDGPWGVTLFARSRDVALARTENPEWVADAPMEVEGVAWWYDNREDGPPYDAAPAAVAAYIAAALTEGAPS